MTRLKAVDGAAVDFGPGLTEFAPLIRDRLWNRAKSGAARYQPPTGE